MTVLLVSEPGTDGVLRHVEGLADFLLAKGVGVHLAWSDRKTSDRLFAFIDRVQRAGGETLNLRVGNAPSPSDLRALWRLAAMAKRLRPDVIHGHSSKGGALVRLLPLVGVRAPVFYTPHAYYRMNGGGGVKTALFHSVERVLGRVGRTINLSPDEARFASEKIGLSEASQLVIPNGVDLSLYTPASPTEKRRLRGEFGLDENARLLGTVGRLSTQKDPVTLYTALAATPEIHFAHLGDGELAGEVNAIIDGAQMGQRVKRIPYLANPKAFYQMLDGFVLPSLYEGMSYAILEAMAMNLPLVLTRCPGNWNFLNVGLSAAYWAQPGDASSIAAAMRSCVASLGAGLIPNHREIAAAGFSSGDCYQKVLESYGTPGAARLPALGAP